jgi:hypothetical protein
MHNLHHAGPPQVMHGKGSNSMALTVAGIVVVFIVLWWLTQK